MSKKKKSQAVVDEIKHEEVEVPEDVREEDEVSPTTRDNVAKLEAQTTALSHPLDDQPLSPVSTASSTSEAPLAEQVKINGGSSGYNSNPSTPAKTTHEIPERSENGAETPSTETPSAPRTLNTAVRFLRIDLRRFIGLTAGAGFAQPSTAPDWLKREAERLLAKYPGSMIEVVLRKLKPDKPAEWRIRCRDCPPMVWFK